jgi:hypothetical protein
MNNEIEIVEDNNLVELNAKFEAEQAERKVAEAKIREKQAEERREKEKQDALALAESEKKKAVAEAEAKQKLDFRMLGEKDRAKNKTVIDLIIDERHINEAIDSLVDLGIDFPTACDIIDFIDSGLIAHVKFVPNETLPF